jgi:hypothetical protein
MIVSPICENNPLTQPVKVWIIDFCEENKLGWGSMLASVWENGDMENISRLLTLATMNFEKPSWSRLQASINIVEELAQM